MAACSIEILSARPTALFLREDAELRHLYEVTVFKTGEPTSVEASCETPSGCVRAGQVRVEPGKSVIQIPAPDVRDPARLTFRIAEASLEILHRPFRHWTVHIVQFSHHDLGYTGLPSQVLPEMARYLDDALRYCRETDDYPEESRFRCAIEQGWSLLHWMRTRPEEARREMLLRLREGRLEVNALTGNLITELLGPEEMARALYPVFALKREHGIPVVCAEHNDIPGISRGLAEALAAAGIRYFAPGLPDYFRWGQDYHTFWDEVSVAPGGRPHAFWWESPSGERILFWHGAQGAGGPVDVRMPALLKELERLEETDYPFDILRYQVRGGERDNSPYRREFADTCCEWNARYAYPRLEMSLNSRFFAELERQLTPETPVFCGELPGTDYCVGASCTAYASGINRVTHDRLLTAERLATLAQRLTDWHYPREELEEAYHCTLMNDEHCWGLAHPVGPGQDAAIAQHCEFAFRAAALAHDVTLKALYELADRVGLREDGFHVLVFNPLDRPRTDVATVKAVPFDPCDRPLRPRPGDPQDPADPGAILVNYPVSNHGIPRIPAEVLGRGARLVDVETGEEAPCETVVLDSPDAPEPYAGYRVNVERHDPGTAKEIRFLAREVPAVGWRVYRLVAADAPPAPLEASAGHTLGSPFYHLEMDPQTGAVRSLYDRELGKELVDTASGDLLNQMILRSSITGERIPNESLAIIRIQRTPLREVATVETSSPGYPRVVQQVSLHRYIKRVDFATRVLKDASAHIETFIAFPFALEQPRFRYEGTLSVNEPGVDQFPGANTDYHAVQHWASAEDGGCCVTLTSLDAAVLQFGGNWPLYVSQAHHGVTPPGFGRPFHDPAQVTRGHISALVLLNNYRTNFTPYQTGEALFRFSLTSFPPDPSGGRSRDFGYGVCLPFECASISGAQEGPLPPSTSWLTIQPANAMLLALKAAEDDRGTIVRLLETEGQDTDVTVSVRAFCVTRAFRTTLTEEDLEEILCRGGEVTFPLRACSVTTLRLLSS